MRRRARRRRRGSSDIIGLLAAFVILMVLFRALVPTVIPLLFAIVAVLGAFLLLFLAARLTHFNTITEILVPMIGLGVGIDYTLFIVTRFRQFLHDGLSPQEAAAAAGATAGRAVIFAGVTVAISITGLALIGLDFITKLGIGSALGVLTAVLLANSLLPAVLSLLGQKIDRGRLGLPPVDESREGQARTPVAAWGRFVSGNAKVVLPVVIVVLLLLASPVLGGPARPGRRRHGAEGSDHAQGLRPAVRRASAPGSPSRSRSSSTCSPTTRPPTKLETALRKVPGLAAGRQADLQQEEPRAWRRSRSSTPTGSTSRRTRRPTTSSRSLRAHRDPGRRSTGSSAHAYVSGSNAAFTDIGNRIFSHAPWFLLYIIGITFLLLAMAFRSAVIALKAALTTLLSALVGFGVLTLVVQKGYGMGIIGLDRTGPIESFVPPIAFAILFGLSMDYEVFLMSRIREEHVHGEDTVDAVKDGVAGVGRVIVAAALIMSSVFFSFLLSPDRVSKEFGLLLGVAILTDALLMRHDARAGAAHAAARALVGDPRLAREARCRTSRSSRRASASSETRHHRRRSPPTSRRADGEAQVRRVDLARRLPGRAATERREPSGRGRPRLARVEVRHEGLSRQPCNRGRRWGNGRGRRSRRAVERERRRHDHGSQHVRAVRGPWGDSSWNGWWGDDPPYHTPVFVLTHHAREP